jgi:hypothetical protein
MKEIIIITFLIIASFQGIFSAIYTFLYLKEILKNKKRYKKIGFSEKNILINEKNNRDILIIVEQKENTKRKNYTFIKVIDVNIYDNDTREMYEENPSGFIERLNQLYGGWVLYNDFTWDEVEINENNDIECEIENNIRF